MCSYVCAFNNNTTIFVHSIKKEIKWKRIKIIGIWTLTWLCASLILFSTGFFGRNINVEAANSKLFSEKELNQDLQQLESYIMKENPLFFADREELKKRFNATYDKIEEGMTELEFYRLINPLVVDVKCGHTNLYISEALQKNREETAKFFPLEVTLVNNELYILEDDETSSIKAGDKIKSINGKSSDQIIEILLNNISGDGEDEAKQRYIIRKYFNSRFYDFVDNSEEFEVEYLDKDGDISTANLIGKYENDYNMNAWGLHFDAYKDGNYYDSEIYNDYAVLGVHVFMQEKEEKFASFLERFFLELKERDISKLIIDLRGNFGASPQMSKTLLSHLINKETDYFTDDLPFLQRLLGFTKPISPAADVFDGKLFVLTDGANFSTAAHFCAMIRYHNLGILLGSKTGGSYACTDSSKDVVLKNTRMRLHYSTLVYKLAVKGLPKNTGIEPDIKVKENIKSILNNQDLQIERALQLLGVGNSQ